MIKYEVYLAACRAYVQAVNPGWTLEDPDEVERVAVRLADGQTVPGMLTMPGPLLKAITAAVEADRDAPVTRQYI